MFLAGDPGSIAQTILREISVRAQVFVTLISIFNCAGRMFWGLASDFGLNRYGISRPFFFGIVVAIMCVVQVLLLVFDSEPPRYRCHPGCILAAWVGLFSRRRRYRADTVLSTGVWMLYVAAIFGGSSYGALNSLNPMIVSELYGTESMGAIYTAMQA